MHKLIDRDVVYQQLQTKGFRLTKARRCLIAALIDNVTPLSATELQAIMQKEHIGANATTIYRELEFLRSEGIIHELQFGDDGTKRFEFGLGPHHHHIRCLQCNRIADVDIPHTFTRAISTIEEQTKFKVIDHSLEFVGLCDKCQRNTSKPPLVR